MKDPYSERPPVFRSWKGWYVFLVAVLVVQVVIYYWLTLRFS